MKSAVLSCIDSICTNWIFYSFDASTCFITALCLLSVVVCFCLLGSRQPFVHPSVCLPPYILFASRPVGRFVTGVALVKPSSGIKRERVRQALSHYAGPPLLALIETSDPKLMRKGATAHLLSTADVLQRQTGKQQWQCWICFVGSDNCLQTLTHLVISHSVFAIFFNWIEWANRIQSVHQ